MGQRQTHLQTRRRRKTTSGRNRQDGVPIRQVGGSQHDAVVSERIARTLEQLAKVVSRCSKGP